MKDTLVSVTLIEAEDTPVHLTLDELSRACGLPPQHITAWVQEGIIDPSEGAADGWAFHGASLRRALVAARLTRDLDVATADLGLVLDLLDEISRLQGQLRQRGAG